MDSKLINILKDETKLYYGFILWAENFGHTSLEPTNQNAIKVPKHFMPSNNNLIVKLWRTRVINSPLTPPSLDL